MKLSNVKRMLVAGAAALAMVAFASPAKAALVIDFGTGTTGNTGVFGLLPGGNAFGTGISVGVMTVSGGAPGDGLYDTSGTGVGNLGDVNGSAVLSFNTATNTISITGGIPALVGVPNGTVLLNGSFLGFTANALGLSGAFGPDTKSPLLLTALGIPTSTPFAYFGFALTSGNTVTCPPGSGATTCWSVGSTDIRNASVPEPGSMILLGTGLLGLGGAIRRRLGR